MFTVKATYRGETRKISFPFDNSFPSFDQLCNQLYRVFPISHNYFLSKLLFSPDASQSSRILIGREIHNTEEYIACINQFNGNSWRNGLLRFSVFDETPHKIPSAVSVERSASHMSAHRNGLHSQHPERIPDCRQDPQSMPPISMFHIPPPPIIFSSSRDARQVPMDVDSRPPVSQGSPNLSPQHGRESTCCPVSQGRKEIQEIISSFQGNLERILSSTFGTPSGQAMLSSLPPTTAPLPTSALCSNCTQQSTGNSYSCEHCRIVMCNTCYEKDQSGFCFSVMGSHSMKLINATQSHFSSTLMPDNSIPHWLRWSPYTGTNVEPVDLFEPARTLPFIPPDSMFPTALGGSPPSEATPKPLSQDPEAPFESASVPQVTNPVIHQGIICDMCNKTIEGVRHKCLDCPDYDLCTRCIEGEELADRHDPFHEFFEITEPGRVIVHTVFSGVGERNSSNVNINRREPVVSGPAIHLARCDLCDSRINGDRYKCLNCPDFDTCMSCFSITPTQHPRHGFVKISKPEDYVRMSNARLPMHFATCNACNRTIRGVRYKCMHPDCPDFDLCEGCEAHPISVHPDNHPLLKMKAVETVIPTVYQVGETKLIDSPKRQSFQSSDVKTASSVTVTMVPQAQPRPSPPFYGRFSPPSQGDLLNVPYKAFSTPADIDSPRNISTEDCSLLSTPQMSSQVPPEARKSRVDAEDADALASIFHNLLHVSGSNSLTDEETHPAVVPDLALRAIPRNDLPEPSPVVETPPDFCVQPMTEAPNTVSQPDQRQPDIPNDLSHLLQASLSLLTHLEPTLVARSRAASIHQFDTPVMESPLTGESLLSRPTKDTAGATEGVLQPTPFTMQTLTALLEGCQSLTPASAPSPISSSTTVNAKAPVRPETPLAAVFVEDVTVPDGQVFPPGAEFMKCWKVLNASDRDWPEATQLVFVAGESLALDRTSVQSVKVGSLKAGAEIDLWSCELKAPDAPGKYVGYWRLMDDHGNLFGNSFWIEISVESQHTSDGSMSSSSIIVMPNAAPQASTAPSTEAPATSVAVTATVSAASTLLVSDDDDDSISDVGSDASSISLISMPASDDEDVAVWEDSRSQTTAERAAQTTAEREAQAQTGAMDYVLLYDENSSSEE